MDLGKRITTILFLERDRFDLYYETQNKKYSFDLKPFVSNLEVIDKENLYQQVKAFIEAYKIAPSNIIIVLSDNVLFVKGMPPGKNPEDEEKENRKFQEAVPFEHIQIKSYPIEGGKLLVATNKSYFEEIKTAFEKCSFHISSVVPIYSTGVIVDPSVGIDEAASRIILKNAVVLNQYRLDTEEVGKVEVKKPESTDQKPSKARIYALGGIFGFLILILIFVTYNSLKSNQTPPKKISQPKSVNSQISSSNPVVNEQASSSAATIPINITVKIVSVNINSQNALSLKKSLTDFGYKNVSIEADQNQTQTSTITFSPSISQDVKTQIANLVSQYSSNYSISQNQITGTDILINLPQ